MSNRRRGTATLPLCKNIPVNDYQPLFPSRVSLYCVPVARANLETKDGWKAHPDWPTGLWLLSLIGSRDRTHPVMAALSFHGVLCVRACTLQAASTSPVPSRYPTPSSLPSPTWPTNHPRTARRQPPYVPRIISKYNHTGYHIHVHIHVFACTCVRTCVCAHARVRAVRALARERIRARVRISSVCETLTYVQRCPNPGPRAIFFRYILPPLLCAEVPPSSTIRSTGMIS